jgi:hypothetical protein
MFQKILKFLIDQKNQKNLQHHQHQKYQKYQSVQKNLLKIYSMNCMFQIRLSAKV